MSGALPTLYKARNLSTKRAVCSIGLDRTQGRTQDVRLAYRVSVWLCAGHACHTCTAKAPSRRTLQRWHAQRRWLSRPP
jgi:hypothetical protein